MTDESSHSEAKKRRARSAPQVTPAWLEAEALRYLNRFDATHQRLQDVLLRKVSRARANSSPADPGPGGEGSRVVPELEIIQDWIAQLIHRLAEAGYLDDRRFANSLTQSLIERGASSRQLHVKLRQRGLAPQLVDDVVREFGHGDDDLYAASRLVRRRRLGWLRSDETRAAKAKKDLAALARAGFSFEVARRALNGPLEED